MGKIKVVPSQMLYRHKLQVILVRSLATIIFFQTLSSSDYYNFLAFTNVILRLPSIG